MKKKLGKKLRNSCETVETYRGCRCYTDCGCKGTKTTSSSHLGKIQKKMIDQTSPGALV